MSVWLGIRLEYARAGASTMTSLIILNKSAMVTGAAPQASIWALASSLMKIICTCMICQYMRHHSIDQVALRINMKVSEGELEAAEATFVTDIDCLMKDIMLINYHWGLCAQLDNQWRLQIQGIGQYTNLVIWDHKAFCPCVL